MREDNGLQNYTYVYTYDNAGNITSVKRYALTSEGATPSGSYTSYSYGYSNGEWGDLLTSYRGQTITYDEIGNPLSYYNGTRYTFSWTGRQLTGAVKGSNNFTFTYGEGGTRVTKTKNGVVTTYYYDGTKLIAEETNGNVTLYLYDASGAPIGMQYRTPLYDEGVWDTYYFDKNLQGDIVAVYNQIGKKLISYTYDAWGNFTTSYYNGGASTTATNNSLTYRGYYYDKDLGLYYLQSRYYDPAVKRFINADGYISTGSGLLGYNMFAYCNNNPVNYVDYSGEEPITLTIVGSVASSVVLAIAAAILVVAAYDATHDQILGNIAADVWDTVTDAVDSVANYVVSTVKSWFGSKAEEKEKISTETQQYNYWTATLVNGVVTPGTPLTYSQARDWVAAENNLLCINHAAAIAIVKFYPSAIGAEAHKGGIKCGYLNHYHLNNGREGQHTNHIWYYGE